MKDRQRVSHHVNKFTDNLVSRQSCHQTARIDWLIDQLSPRHLPIGSEAAGTLGSQALKPNRHLQICGSLQKDKIPGLVFFFFGL